MEHDTDDQDTKTQVSWSRKGRRWTSFLVEIHPALIIVTLALLIVFASGVIQDLN